MADGTTDRSSIEGGLSVGGRMGRIEDTVMRIEKKLERMPDHEDYRQVTGRVELLEAGETPLARIMLKQWETLQESVNSIMQNGSPEAQEALRIVHELDVKVQTHETQLSTRRATDIEAINQHDWLLKIGMALIGVGQLVFFGIEVAKTLSGH